ncbi:unnamed protein product [Agarophyton chilense]|eukprot:gb/GEZJ01005146.1/.p1 GENE.gb/GEZJ01005146.1/~~gb/GEZJ01005146.1/.p1  ORF type:complete len:330 (-),score=22.44 gb/GEZJ01005146.1/:276-1265(-)
MPGSISPIFLFVQLALLSSVYATFQPSCSVNPYVHHFSINNVSATVTSDGPIKTPRDFFSVPDEAVSLSYSHVFRSTSPIVWQQNILLIDLPIGRVLVDTGANRLPVPPFAATGILVDNLLSIGIEPESIEVILITHGHPDHVSGLVDSQGNRTFPHATVYVPRVEYEFWTAEPFVNPNPLVPNATLESFRQIFTRSLSAYEGDLVLVPDGTSPVPDVTFLLFPGHTPGHSAIQINVGGGKKIVCVGDAWISQPDQLRHPEWVRPVETDGLQSFRSRVSLMANLSRTGDLVLAFHEDFPGLGHIVNTSQGFDWVPMASLNRDVVRTQCS